MLGLGQTAGLDASTRLRAPLSSLQKYDYDSSSVRKRFFREALLQITIPFLLKKLAPTCKSVSPCPCPPQCLSLRGLSPTPWL
jgi:hypothetical protein